MNDGVIPKNERTLNKQIGSIRVIKKNEQKNKQFKIVVNSSNFLIMINFFLNKKNDIFLFN